MLTVRKRYYLYIEVAYLRYFTRIRLAYLRLLIKIGVNNIPYLMPSGLYLILMINYRDPLFVSLLHSGHKC